jgi:hypothetical protein
MVVKANAKQMYVPTQWEVLIGIRMKEIEVRLKLLVTKQFVTMHQGGWCMANCQSEQPNEQFSRSGYRHQAIPLKPTL